MPHVPRLDPPYLLVAAMLRQQIEERKFTEGQKLPGTTKLAVEFGVTPSTVSKAFRVLVREGVLITERRRGTFVQPRTEWRPNDKKQNPHQI